MNLLQKCSVLFLTILLLIGFSAAGASLTLQEAIEHGLEESPALSENRENIAGLENELLAIEAARNWKVDFSGNVNKPMTSDARVGFDLDSNKNFQGINISPSLSYQAVDFDFSDPLDNIELGFSLSTELYPVVPAGDEIREKELLENIETRQKEFLNKQNSLIIDWVEQYLALYRQKQLLQIREERLVFNSQHLENVKKQKEIGQAGESSLLSAEIDFREAELAFQNASRDFQQQKENWYRELALDEEQSVEFVEESSFIADLKELEAMELINNREKLLANLLEKNLQLRGNLIQQERAKRGLDLLKKESLPQISAGAGYDITSTNWRANISLSYNLYDGGQHQLKVVDREKQISNIEDDYYQLKKQLEEQLDQRIQQLENSKQQLEIAELKRKKRELDNISLEDRFAEGLITRQDYRNRRLDEIQEEISLQAARNDVFINKLRLLHLAGERF